MNADVLLRHFDRISDTQGAVPRLRNFILDLAVRGKLVSQDSNDEPARGLLMRIQLEKSRLARSGETRKERALPTVSEEELPYQLPQQWCWSRLAEVGFLNPRNTAPNELAASFVPMPMISAEYGIPNRHEVRAWSDIKSGFTHFAEGDVALAKITPCFENGKSTVLRGLTGGIGAGTTELHVVRPVLVCPEYILIFLKCPHFIQSGAPKMTGTAGQKRVPTAYFAFSPFPLPPLAEQHRIVRMVRELMALCDRLGEAQKDREARRDRLATASLSALNNNDAHGEELRENARFFIDHLQRLTVHPKQIEEVRRTVRSLAIKGCLVKQDNNDEPALHLLKRLETEIQTYSREQKISLARPDPIGEEVPFSNPPGWTWTRLCSLFNVITDGDHQPPPKSDAGIAFLTIGNVTTGVVDFSDCRFVPHSYWDSVADYRKPSSGDILYTVVGATYGRPVPVETKRPFCVQRHIAILKPTREICTRFVCLLLASPLVYKQATECKTGAAQPTVALRPLRNFLVPLPPLAEQYRIVAKVDELMFLCDRLEEQLKMKQAESHHLLEAVLSEALAA